MYSMSLSVTMVKKNTIHSLISLPFVNFNLKYNFADPTLTEKDIESIHQIFKMAKMPIDTILCAKASQMKLLSSSTLLKCLKTQNNIIFYCQERLITYFNHNTQGCTQLPETIIIEMSPKKLLIKTKLQMLTICCNNLMKNVPLNSTLFVLEIKPNLKCPLMILPLMQ